MNSHRILAAALLVALAAQFPSVSRATESFDSCQGTIASLPTVVSTSGIWCLTGDLATSIATGSAIQITVNNVTIDCNGFRLGGLGAGDGTATIGVLASNKSGINVRNCHIRGFKYGVQGSGFAMVVEDNRIEGSTQRGVSLAGDGVVVRRNQVLDTGGSTVGGGTAYGIYASGSSDIADNQVVGVSARAGSGQSVWGIFVADVDAPGQIVVSGNSVRSLMRDGAGTETGIRSISAGRVSLRNNAVFGNAIGVGLRCDNDGGSVRENSILGFPTAIQGCSSDGGNIAKP
jgi:hypothetical protein